MLVRLANHPEWYTCLLWLMMFGFILWSMTHDERVLFDLADLALAGLNALLQFVLLRRALRREKDLNAL